MASPGTNKGGDWRREPPRRHEEFAIVSLEPLPHPGACESHTGGCSQPATAEIPGQSSLVLSFPSWIGAFGVWFSCLEAEHVEYQTN